jgi:hypothetical protein
MGDVKRDFSERHSFLRIEKNQGGVPLGIPLQKGFHPSWTPQNGEEVSSCASTFAPYGRAFLSGRIFFTLAAE